MSPLHNKVGRPKIKNNLYWHVDVGGQELEPVRIGGEVREAGARIEVPRWQKPDEMKKKITTVHYMLYRGIEIAQGSRDH